MVAAAAASLLVLSNGHAETVPFPWLLVYLGASFCAVGIAARLLRPENRSGALLYGVGLAIFAVLLAEANHPALFTIGLALGSVVFAAIVHLLLAYPTGVVSGRSLAVVRAGYTLAALGPAASMLVADDPAHCADCPRNLIAITNRPELANAIDAVTQVTAAVLILSAAVLLVRRWQAASGAYRRALRGVYGSGAVTVLLLIATFALGPLSRGVGLAVITAAAISFGTLPFAFLLGLLRARFAGAAVGRVVSALGPNPAPGDLRQALRDVLHDPSLEIGYRLSEQDGYVDIGGLPFAPAAAAAVTNVEGAQGTVGVLAHDPALLDDPRLLEGVVGSVRLAFENERLHAELRARLVELRASRARIVAAGDEERRKLERNLHDGAQQRLVSVLIGLRLAGTAVERSPEEAREKLHAASHELTQAIAELRELARGIHPAILTERGLGPALVALAERTPLPVDVQYEPTERLPAPVEAAAYYVVSESLTNVVKHAGAAAVEVRVTRRDGLARVEVADDGVGGASTSSGSGLRGLVDRVEALEGRLGVVTGPGGTRVWAEIPCL